MFINSPMNYTGSKFKLLDQIINEFDFSKSNFFDLFTGSFVVSANVLDKYNKISANDIIEDIINIHKSILENDDIIDNVKSICPKKTEKEVFLELRKSYNKEKSADKLWALMLSSTNNMMRFNKKFEYNQTFGERGWNDSIEKKADAWSKHIRKSKEKIHFHSKNFSMIDVELDTFYYLDPPYGYIIDSNEIGKKQISEAGYNNYYNKQDDIDLYNYVNKINDIGSTFMLSGVLEHGDNRSWLLDKLISDGYTYKVLDFNYNKVSRVGDKKTVEVFIKNF